MEAWVRLAFGPFGRGGGQRSKCSERHFKGRGARAIAIHRASETVSTNDHDLKSLK